MSMAWLASVALIAGCCCCGTPEPPSNGVQIKVDVNGLSDAEVEDLKGKLAAIAGNDSNMSTVFNGAATWNYSTDDQPPEEGAPLSPTVASGRMDPWPLGWGERAN
jgi:hypothetical protein